MKNIGVDSNLDHHRMPIRIHFEESCYITESSLP